MCFETHLNPERGVWSGFTVHNLHTEILFKTKWIGKCILGASKKGKRRLVQYAIIEVSIWGKNVELLFFTRWRFKSVWQVLRNQSLTLQQQARQWGGIDSSSVFYLDNLLQCIGMLIYVTYTPTISWACFMYLFEIRFLDFGILRINSICDNIIN